MRSRSRALRSGAILAMMLALVTLSACKGCETPVEETDFFGPTTFGEYEFDGVPDIEAPERVFFGDVAVGERKLVTAEIQNVGRATLKYNEWKLEGDFTLSFVDRIDPPDETERSSSVLIALEYEALDTEEARGTLMIGSNDPDEPETVIELYANAKFPCLETLPAESVDFGEVEQGESATRTVEIRNCSSNAETTFSLGSLRGDDEFGWAREPEFDSMTLGVGESVSIFLDFQPESAGEFRGTLDIESNDEFRPLHELELRGTGALGVCPTPIIHAEHPSFGEVVANPTASIDALPLDRIRLTAEDSRAYDGKIIDEYQWTLIRRPTDSAAALSNGSGSIPQELYLDLSGEYVVELDVIDSEEVPACQPARVTIRAISNEDIHIQLVWDTPNDPNQLDASGTDVDLHLLNPNAPGAAWNDDPWDCFWQNLLPDWGDRRPEGVTSVDCERDPDRPGCQDDPSLDIDDVDGWGPENINLNNPRNNWTYAIGVHYFSDHAYGISYATVRVFVGGILKAEYRRQRLMHDQFWYVADIDWPSAEIRNDGRMFDDGFPTEP